ncbi:serine/threonine-protein kinase [Streptomyces spiramyceticus]|uniref:serine/threonine-protein kinase n=1 Tax=Streptomyces spiramyceticus TaxID=299717 RepID=UPI00237B2648|nr:serine/threonine-protein kinase [Streptomyces spiramyceticus]
MSGPGDIVDGRFELLERLGSGGMGTVWRARDTALHREVALKEVRPSGPASTGDAEASRVLRERVLREARALARINHPHVVTIHHIIDEAPHPWLVMELVPGHTLQHCLEQGPLPPQEAARTGREVLSALRAAHTAGIHHRDVKPANVLLRADGSAVLTDFGIAALQDSASLTMTGEVIGSPEYMAPERLRGAAETAILPVGASDFWSLGMMLYVCVEGVSPMRRGSTLATLAAVLDDPIPPPRQAGPLGPVLAELLVRDPTARPDADRLDALLAGAAAGRLPAPPPLPVPPSPTHFDPSRPAAYTPPLPPQSQQTVQSVRSEPSVRPEGQRRNRAPFAAAAAVVALALLCAGAYAVLKPEGKAGTTAGLGGSGSTTTVTASATPDTKGPETSPAPSTPAPTAPPPTTPQSTPPPTKTSATPPQQPPAVADSWIAQLHSEPLSSGSAALDRRLATVRRQVPGAQVLRSDDFSSLRPGYWVIYAPGPFSNGRQALSFCAERGRTTANECVGRWVSDSTAHRTYLCRPPASAPTGRCTRP